jgi:hypothetical protein
LQDFEETEISEYNDMLFIALPDFKLFSCVNGISTTNFINVLGQEYKNNFGVPFPKIV